MQSLHVTGSTFDLGATASQPGDLVNNVTSEQLHSEERMSTIGSLNTRPTGAGSRVGWLVYRNLRALTDDYGCSVGNLST